MTQQFGQSLMWSFSFLRSSALSDSSRKSDSSARNCLQVSKWVLHFSFEERRPYREAAGVLLTPCSLRQGSKDRVPQPFLRSKALPYHASENGSVRSRQAVDGLVQNLPQLFLGVALLRIVFP